MEKASFTLRGYASSLIDPNCAVTGLKVALVVGSALFTINHGAALINGEMTRDRWRSGLLTYCVPYLVNIHGQYSSRVRKRRQTY